MDGRKLVSASLGPSTSALLNRQPSILVVQSVHESELVQKKQSVQFSMIFQDNPVAVQHLVK